MSSQVSRCSWKHWFFLFAAIVFEVGGTSLMKLSQSGTLMSPPVGYVTMLVCIAFSYYFLSLSTQGLPVGVAFAFWEGLGLTLITVVSVLALGEHLSLLRFVALLCVLSGALLIHHGTEGTPDEQAADLPSMASSRMASSRMASSRMDVADSTALTDSNTVRVLS